MNTKGTIDLSDFVRDDRRNWRADELLSPGALLDFQKLCDDAFQSMRGKYFRAADLIAEMRLRKRLRIRVPRKFQRADNRILLLADLVDARSRRLRPPSPPSTRVAERAVTEDVTKTPALDSSFR
jgi:hypothetical protein